MLVAKISSIHNFLIGVTDMAAREYRGDGKGNRSCTACSTAFTNFKVAKPFL